MSAYFPYKVSVVSLVLRLHLARWNHTQSLEMAKMSSFLSFLCCFGALDTILTLLLLMLLFISLPWPIFTSQIVIKPNHITLFVVLFAVNITWILAWICSVSQIHKTKLSRTEPNTIITRKKTSSFREKNQVISCTPI